MDLHEVIARRESVRSYDPSRPVDDATLHRILEAGRLAPSAANRQPWTFVLVRSEEALARVRPCYPRPWFQDAPLVLAVVGNPGEAWVRSVDGQSALETDLAIAMAHLILAAAREGVASCWIANFDPPGLREALKLSDDEEVFAVTPLGYPKADFVAKINHERKPMSEILRVL